MSRTLQNMPIYSAALFGIVVLCLSPARATAPSPALQHRIDVLLKHRLRPEALPVIPPNPFQMISGATRGFAPDELGSKLAAADDSAAVTAPAGVNQSNELADASHAEVLIGCATQLKLGGIIILGDRIQIVINGVARKEGDAVAADWKNTIVYLRIARLLPGRIVLRYGEAEATVKF